MLTHVYLLRHAETADPTLFHGAESEIGLSPRGQQQADAIARVLAPWQPNVVISSAMLRARSTAQPIAQAAGVPHLLVPTLHERKVGALAGTAISAAEAVWRETLCRWLAGEVTYAPLGSESLAEVQARVLQAWQNILTEWAGRKLVVVAHGHVIRVLLLSILPGYTFADWPRVGSIKNTALTELIHQEGVWHAERINEPQPGVPLS